MDIRLRDASRTYTISSKHVLYERPVRLSSRSSAERFLRRCLRADPLANRRALEDLLGEHGHGSGSATSLARDAAPLVQGLHVTARPRAGGHRLVFGKRDASRRTSGSSGRPADLEVQPDGRVVESSLPVAPDPPSYDPRCIDCGWTQKEAVEGDTVTMSLRFEQVPPSARHVRVQVYRRHPDASKTYIEDVRGTLTHSGGEATAELDWTVPGASATRGGKRVEGSYVFRATIPETGTRVGSGQGPRTYGMLRVQGYWEVVFAISDEFEPLTVLPADNADVHGRPLLLTNIRTQETAPSIDIPTGRMCRVGVPLRWGGDLLLTRNGQTVGRITQDQLTGGPDPDEPFWYVLAGPNASFDLPKRSTESALDAVGDEATGVLGAPPPENPDSMARTMAEQAAADHVAVPDAIDDVVPPQVPGEAMGVALQVQEALRNAAHALSEGIHRIGDLDSDQRDWLVQVLFGDLKTLKPGKVTSKIIKLATEDQNVLRYLFGNDAKIAVTETGESLNVTLKGSMRVDLSPTTTWPKLLDNRTGKSPTTVRIDWGDGTKRVIGEGVAGKFRGVNGLLMFVAVGHDYWTWTREHDSDFVDLLVDIGITVSKAILTEIIATGLVYALVALFGGAPALAIIGGLLLASILVGAAIEYVDETFGISDTVQKWVDQTQMAIDRQFGELIHLIESGAVYHQLTI